MNDASQTDNSTFCALAKGAVTLIAIRTNPNRNARMKNALV